MQSFPKNIDKNLDSVTNALLQISRIREEDITDRNSFPSIFMKGRKVGKVPSAYNDVAASDRVGDFNYDENNYYLCVQSGSTVIWKIQPFNGIGIYGEAYARNITQTVTVSVKDVFYELTDGLTAGELSGVTFGGNQYLTVLFSGRYLANMSVSVDSGGASQEVEAGMMIDGVASNKGTAHGVTIASTAGTTLAASAIFDLTANQKVSLCVLNHTGAMNIVVDHATLVLTRIGN